MAKVRIKGKNVTGTKKNDKITWLDKSAWNKALVVKSGNGNDVINFKKSSYTNKIYGGKGNDTITSGKGNDLIYFAKNDGNDKILNGGGIDTLIFTNEKIKKIKATYSKNNVVLTYTGGKITLKNYVKNGHSAQYIQVGKTKKAIEDLLPWNKVKRDGRNYTGTNKKDKVSSNIKGAIISTYNGNDKIEILNANNTITAGKGNDTITTYENGQVYNFSNGDGNDTIIDRYNEGGLALALYNFVNAKNKSDIKISKTNKGYKIGYNSGKDSVNVTMNSRNYKEWIKGDYEYDMIMINKKYYIIKPNGLMEMYTDYIWHPALQDVETEYNGVDSLIASNDDDYISIDAQKIHALGGNDYINAYNGNAEIWGGKGNDTIYTREANLYFNNGDGNDTIYAENSTYIFSDASSTDDISIDKNSKGILISYNNGKDSVTLDFQDFYDYYDYRGYIQIGESTYSMLNTSAWSSDSSLDIDAIIGTTGDDNFEYYIDNHQTPNIIYTGFGNDIVNLSNSGYLYTYFNMDLDKHMSDFLCIDNGYWAYGIDDNREENTYESYGNLKIADYFSKGTTTIKDLDNKQLDMTNIEEVKTAVAGWLTAHSEYADVTAAINDETNGADNFRILMGSDYFGKLSWQENS